MQEPAVLARIRTFLLVTFALGAAGTSAELLLLRHFESMWEAVPLVLLAVGLLTSIWHAAAPSRASVLVLQTTMVLLLASGGIGIGLHYDGNVDLQRERFPDASGAELINGTLTGTIPVLAPGAMTLLGLVGLAHAYRHPCLTDPSRQ